jgi:hypothetical protein
VLDIAQQQNKGWLSLAAMNRVAKVRRGCCYFANAIVAKTHVSWHMHGGSSSSSTTTSSISDEQGGQGA